MFYAVSDDAMLKMQKISEMADAEDWTAAELILKLAQYNSSLLNMIDYSTLATEYICR